MRLRPSHLGGSGDLNPAFLPLRAVQGGVLGAGPGAPPASELLCDLGEAPLPFRGLSDS